MSFAAKYILPIRTGAPRDFSRTLVRMYVLVVRTLFSFRRWRKQWFWQFLRLDQPLWELDPVNSPALFILAPRRSCVFLSALKPISDYANSDACTEARTSQVPADNRFERDDACTFHKHSATLQLLAVLLSFCRHSVDVGGDEMVRYHIA